MFRLENTVQSYEWGSHSAIAELSGKPPSDRPEAELWMGAHPSAPSKLAGTTETLLDAVTQRPDSMLGKTVRSRFSEFPFMLKVLAAAAPLSLQAHPSKAQAEAGFDAEEAAGIARTAPNRNYKDKNHKPELLCALTRFEALCGFRAAAEAIALLDLLAVDALTPSRARLVAGPPADALREIFRDLMTRSDADRAQLVTDVVAACDRILARGPTTFRESLVWCKRLAERYPGDIGAVSSLLLNHLALEPGEAIYLPAGNLHAYLEGTGIEIMASSDNVLRGGLTPKHVDVPELLKVLDFTSGPIEPILPTLHRPEDLEAVYVTSAPEFRLSRIDLDGSKVFSAEPLGPEIVICTSGSGLLTGTSGSKIELPSGESAFIAASDGPYRISGTGSFYRATVNTS